MNRTLLFLTLLFSIFSFSQKRILVFHKTNGFSHGSIGAGITMFEDLGNENGEWITDNSDDSSVFNTANLVQYDLVVFLNTSGTDESSNQDGDLLSASEKAAFENFIAVDKKGFIGVHAATDTYRNGVWPFYNQLVGGIVQTNPNHTSNNFNADMAVKANHLIIDFLGGVNTVWNKNEEYYYWKENGGQLSTDNLVLLEVEETIGPNGMVNSYDEARPITWYKESFTYNNGSGDTTVTNIKSFYTALGHNSSDYQSNTNFRTMLKNATLWALGESTLSINNNKFQEYKIFPNPAKNHLSIFIPESFNNTTLNIYDILGKNVLEKNIASSDINNNKCDINIEHLKVGAYVLILDNGIKKKHLKLVKN